jgi:hypothetical protein
MAPPPTESELKLRSILRYKKIPFKHSQIIWYTGCDKYFNKSFSDIGITVERSEIKSECNAVLMKFDKAEKSAYSCLVEWTSNIS